MSRHRPSWAVREAGASRKTRRPLEIARLNPALIVAASLWAISVSSSALAGNPDYSVPDRSLFAEYRALDRDRIAVALAVRPERTADLALHLQARGAAVLGRRDSIGYLYAIVPIELVASLPGIEGVQAVQLMGTPTRTDASDAPAGEGKIVAQAADEARGPAPSPSLGADNPFTAESATQALAFKSGNPTFDGRGVVIAFVEPAAPNLTTMRGALDMLGRPIAKFARYDLGRPIEIADPVADWRDMWQRTEQVRPQADGRFSWHGRIYKLPPEAGADAVEWRMGRRLSDGSGIARQTYDLLWAVDEDRVWALPMTDGSDFAAARSAKLGDAVASIPVGDDAGRRRDGTAAQALIFERKRDQRLLAVAPTHAFHAGMVGSVMAGSRFFDSAANGVAPAARIAIYLAGRVQGAPSLPGIEAQLDALTEPGVDVAQASYAIGDTARFDRLSVFKLWAERAIASNGRPFVKAIGNYGPRLFASDEFSNAPSVFAIGGYTPQETWLANFGIRTQPGHRLASYSGWGPADDGGLKPDFLSLTHTIAEGVGTRWYWRDTPGFEQYAVSGGTSAAAPHGAGHIALLIGAAKQKGIPHDAARLRAAIATSARFLEDVPARAQGHGLIQVDDAWKALQRAKDWEPPSFAVEAPLVGAEIGPRGAERGFGRGLFELSGWKPGQSGRREIKITRMGGGAGAVRYKLRWKGDVAAFGGTPAEISLPLGKPVTVPVQIHLGKAGGYSAILDLVDPVTGLVAGSILCTVAAADDLPADGELLRYRRAGQRPGNELFYVQVPTGMSAFTVKVRKDGGAARWNAQDPTGRIVQGSLYGTELAKPFDPEAMKRGELTFTYRDPVPGVWQFWLQNVEPRTADQFAAVADWSQAAPVEVEIGALKEQRDAVDDKAPLRLDVRPGLEPIFIEIRIEAGTKELRLEAEHHDPDAQIGLYVYKLPPMDKRDTLISSDATAMIHYDPSHQQRKTYTLANPPPGVYRVALDPIHVPQQGLEVAFRRSMQR